MPILSNPKHERFAQELAKGRTQLEAYETAGYKGDEAHASRLAGNGKVQGRVTELLKRGAERAECTVASILEELEEARGLAIDIKQPAPAVSASMGKAKLAGLLIERTEHTGKDGGPIRTEGDLDLARRVAFLLAKGA